MKNILFTLLLASILLAACSTSASNQATAQVTIDGIKEFKISMSHSGGYSPNSFTVNKGDTVRFLANNMQPQHKHGITIDAYSIDTEVDAGPNDAPQVIEFKADKAGQFKIWCKTCLEGPFGDHPWMQGTLTVN
jgi:nitrosocyanin